MILKEESPHPFASAILSLTIEILRFTQIVYCKSQIKNSGSHYLPFWPMAMVKYPDDGRKVIFEPCRLLAAP
jgi:hypothetical protein